MREKEIRLLFGSRLFLGLTLVAGIIVACFSLASLLSRDVPSVDAEAGFAAPAELGQIALHGPNDGEPINSRTLLLNVETQSATRAFISVYVNDVYLSTQAIPAGGGVTDVKVDLEEAAIRVGESLLATSKGPVRVTAYLHEGRTSRIVTFDEWSGRVVRPWIEEISAAGGSEAGGSDATVQQLVLHPRQGDRYYFLLASTHQEWLTRQPSDPRVLNRTWNLASGAWMGERNPVLNLENLDYLPEGIYAVLWTYVPEVGNGWRRSPIVRLPLPR